MGDNPGSVVRQERILIDLTTGLRCGRAGGSSTGKVDAGSSEI